MLDSHIWKIEVNMQKQMIRSLTFQDNNAEKAMNSYGFVDTPRIIIVHRWGKGAPAEEVVLCKQPLTMETCLCVVIVPLSMIEFTPAVFAISSAK